MTSSKDILKKLHKDHGANIATIGDSGYEDMERLPTGVFALDLAMGGGWPMGKCSMIYGPESSNKTNLILSSIREGQIKYPDKIVAYIDPEFAIDRAWAARLGVDNDRFILIQPENAEQCVDMVESFMYAEDVFAVCLDSIAALTTKNEIESEAGKMIVGGASILVGKMYRKILAAQSSMAKAGKLPPAFLAINQIRHKIGVMFGNPETYPGGNPPKFASSMIVRVYGKNIMDNKVNAVMPLYKEVNCVLQKWKCPILAINAVFKMQMIDAAGRTPGYVEDWNTVSSYAKELDYLNKGDKGGWVLSGNEFNTLQAARDWLYNPENVDFLQSLKGSIISDLIEAGGIKPQETVDEETGEIVTNE